MTVEKTIARLEERLREVEDQLAVMKVLASYGPLVDTGQAEAAAALWVGDGTYDVGGIGVVEGRDQIAQLYEGEDHQGLIRQGAAHLTAYPVITIDRDRAEAVGYSVVLIRESNGWAIWRASANQWFLVRTAAGWRVARRRNRVLDGSEESIGVLRHAPRTTE